MNASDPNESRRQFLQSSAAAGALAFVPKTSAGSETQAVAINAMSPTPKQVEEFLALDHAGPVVMVNLLKFKPDGAAEYMKYAAGIAPILKRIGARVLLSGRATVCLIGNAEWDAVALVEYPDKMALMKMVQSPEYQAIAHHREAGLAGQVNYAVIQGNLAPSP